MTKPTPKNQPQDKGGSASVLVAVWAIALLVIFFAYRGEDIGQLSSLLGGLGHGPYFGTSGFLGSLAGLAIAILIGLSWFGLGRTITSFTGILHDVDSSRFLDLTNSVAVGAAGWSLIWFVFGIAGLYRSAVAIIALVAGLVLGAWQLMMAVRGRRAINTERTKLALFDKLLIALVCIPLLLAMTESLAPPTAKDALLYHRAVPKAFVAQGSNAVLEGNIASYFPMGTEMHSVWTTLLGNVVSARAAEAAPGATIFLFFPLLLLTIYGWAKELNLENTWRWLAVLVFASVPTAFHVAANSYTDVALALYVTLAIYALGRWWKTLDPRWLVGIAVFLGAALSVKLTTLFVFAGFALLVLLRAREAKDGVSANVGKIFASGALALVVGLVVASPWFLRTWKATGSPIFPFYMNIWKGQAPDWDIDRSHLYQTMNSNYGGENKTAVDYVTNPVRVSLMAQPEQATLFDGVIGAIFLFGLPLLIWALWKFELPTGLKAGLGVCLVIFLFWLFSSEQLRYLMPTLPLLSLAICTAVRTIGQTSARFRQACTFALTLLAAAGILTALAWYLQKAPLRVVLGGESKNDYLTRNLDYYPYYQLVNTQTPADAKIWLINMRRDSYNIDRTYFSDFLFEDWTLKKLVWESRDITDLRGRIHQMGISYLLARTDYLLDYSRSAIVDEQKSDAENEAKMKLLNELIVDQANTIRSDQKFSLVKVN